MGGYIDQAHEGGGPKRPPARHGQTIRDTGFFFKNKVVGIGLNYICSSIIFFLFVVV